MASGAAATVERASGLQGLVYAGLVLSAASIVLVVHTAGEEPYFVFHVSDFVENVVGGVLLCALFAAWAFACVRYARRAPRALRTLFATACVLWAVINLFYLVTMIHGYHQDLKRFGAWLTLGVAEEKRGEGTNRQNAKTPEEGEEEESFLGFALDGRDVTKTSRRTIPVCVHMGAMCGGAARLGEILPIPRRDPPP